MKNSFFDFFYVSALLTLLGGTAAYFSFCILSHYSVGIFGSYHILVDLALFLLIFGALAAMCVRFFLRLFPLENGEFDLTSPMASRWKFAFVLTFFGMGALKPFTPIFLAPLLANLYGGRVAGDVAYGSTVTEPYLVTIGKSTVLGAGSYLNGNFVNNGKITIGRVKIGDNVTIGMNVIVFPDVEIGDNAVVALNSVVMHGTRIPAGEMWKGNPARKWQ